MKRKGNNIGWCDKTANPVCGCPNGCEYCYARSMNDRFHWVPDFSKPQFFPNRLKEFRTKEPMIIFIDSMSDIGYWELGWLDKTIEAMILNNHNTYLALTKNYESVLSLKYISPLFSVDADKPLKFFIGATVTNNAQAQAVIDAGGADFISFEPLMERIKPELLERLQCKWWIVGDLTKNGKPQGVTKKSWVAEMSRISYGCCVPIFMKESLKDIMSWRYLQEFPFGWRVTHD